MNMESSPNQPLFIVGEHHLGVRFYLTARDAASQAQITFTDANPQSIDVTPSSVTVAPTGTASYTVTLNVGGNNNSCSVTLSASGLPAGATANFATNPLTTTGSNVTTTLNIATTAATPLGSSTITVSGSNGGGGCQGSGPGSDTAALVVAAKRVGTVTVGAQVGAPVFGVPASSTYTITVNRAVGAPGAFTAALNVITSLPSGATASFTPVNLSFAAAETTKTSTLTITTTTATPAGSTPFTVQATNTTVSGDSSTGNGTFAVNKANTNTSLTSSANPSKFGQSVTFTATVVRIPAGSGTPTGTVTFKEGATTLGTGTLNGSGVATFATSTLSVGSHSMTAEYGGDGNFNTSASSALTQVVQKSDTSTALSSSVNPSRFGQSVTFTATVTATAPGTGTPAGSVEFFDGATSLGTSTLNGSGQASFATSTLTVAMHSITAKYLGKQQLQREHLQRAQSGGAES